MIIWSQLEKGYRWQRNPTRAWNPTSSPQTTSLDSAATWLEAKWAESIHVCVKTHSPSMLDLGQRADRQWNVNVCMLTNSTALWMGFVITPHHACCIGPVSSPSIPHPPTLLLSALHFSLSLPIFPHLSPSWAIMWSHYLTPCCSRVQLTKTARGPSCGKDSVGTQHTCHPPPNNSSLSLSN